MKSLKTISTSVRRRTFLTCTATVAFTGLMLNSGCNRFIKRGQSPDDEDIVQFEDKSPIGPKYIIETCGMWGMEYAKIEGVGLVTGLKGTGSSAKPGSYREHLLDELRTHKDKIKSPRKLCDSKNTEMVIVRGYVPPGAKKGDLFDVEIEMAPHMDGTSLDDGTVFRTRLRQITRFNTSRYVKEGLVVGLAEGPVLVDSVFESRQEGNNELHGWILGGGETTDYRPMGLTLRTKNYGPKTTTQICKAINPRFSVQTANGLEDSAIPKTDKVINLTLPKVYRHNVKRYSDVIANIRYNETAEQRVNRLDELAKQMTNPADCALAALRLEAIGRDAIPTLKRSLTNPDLEVRFRAAEAITYCGQSDGLEVLGEAAEIEPAFRWHAMTALSVSDDPDAAAILERLMQAESAETRYGAFRALHTRSPEHPQVYGRKHRDFFLHEVPTQASPLVHFSRSKRPEIVVFGDAKVADTFLYVETGTTMRSAGEGKIKLIHYTKEHGREETICSTDVVDLIETLTNHDFTYGRILRIFRQARKDKALLARMVVNAVPGTDRVYEDEVEGSEKYTAEAPPELFRNGADIRKKKPQRVTTDLINGNLSTPEEAKAEKSAWRKMKDLFAGQRTEP